MNRLETFSCGTFLAVAGLALASGCGGNDTTIIAFESKLSVSDDAIDLGEVIIGESTPVRPTSTSSRSKSKMAAATTLWRWAS